MSNEDNDIHPVTLFSPKSTSPSPELNRCNVSEKDDSIQASSNFSPNRMEDTNYKMSVPEAPKEFASNNFNRKSKMSKINLECNRKSFSIDSLLFSSKQYQLKPPLLSNFEVNDDPEKCNE